MKLSHKVASIAITSAAALTLAVSAQTAQADTYNGSEITGHWTGAHGVAGYHVAGQADLVNNGGTWYQNGQEISVDGIIPGYHATETAPFSPQAPQAQPAQPAPVPQQPAVTEPAPQAPSQPSTPTPSKPKAGVSTTAPNQSTEANPTHETQPVHQTATRHSVQQLAPTPTTSKTLNPAQEGKAHAAANPNYRNAKYSDTHSVLPQTGVANTIGLVALGVAAICSALSAVLLLNWDKNSSRK